MKYVYAFSRVLFLLIRVSIRGEVISCTYHIMKPITNNGKIMKGHRGNSTISQKKSPAIKYHRVPDQYDLSSL